MKKFLCIISLILATSLCACVGTGESIKQPLGEILDGLETSSPSPSVKSGWDIYSYVDEFDNPTDDWYISNIEYLKGTFSNSATTKSDLEAMFLIDDEDVAIFLYEYASMEVKNAGSWEKEYNITMLDANNTKHPLIGIMYGGGDRIYIESSKELVLDALGGTDTISFYIEDADYTTTHYLFSVEPSNFKALYDSNML